MPSTFSAPWSLLLFSQTKGELSSDSRNVCPTARGRRMDSKPGRNRFLDVFCFISPGPNKNDLHFTVPLSILVINLILRETGMGTGMGCPGRWWSHWPWRCSRNVWMLCWGTWFSENHWWWVNGRTGWSCGSFPTFVILWSYDSMKEWMTLGLLKGHTQNYLGGQSCCWAAVQAQFSCWYWVLNDDSMCW